MMDQEDEGKTGTNRNLTIGGGKNLFQLEATQV